MYTAAKSDDKRDNVTKKMKTSDVIVRDMNLPFLRKNGALTELSRAQILYVMAFYERHER